MKKFVPVLVLALSLLAFTGCDGLLHNTPLSFVTVTVKNMPMPDGTYSLVGNFASEGWKNDLRTFTVTGGSGSYTGTDCPVMDTNFVFSIVPKGSWSRPWSPATAAPLTPTGFSDGKYEKETIRLILPMDGATHAITIDGSTNPMTMTVK